MTPYCAFRKRDGYYTVETTRDMAVVLPIVDRHSVVLVRAHRPTVGDTPLEIPGGGRDDNETPVQAAKRELLEETGIDVPSVDRFLELPPMAEDTTRRPQMTHVFIAEITMADYEARRPHDEEVAAVELWPCSEAIAACCDGRIYVAPTISVIARGVFSGFLDGSSVDHG